MIKWESNKNVIQKTWNFKSASQLHTPKNLTSYFSIPHDFLFLFFCSPFRLARNSKGNGGYFTRRYWPQGMFCDFVTFIDCLWMIGFVRSSLVAIPKGNINRALFIELFKTVISQACKVALLKKLWLKSQTFVNLANLISTESSGGKFPPFEVK